MERRLPNTIAGAEFDHLLHQASRTAPTDIRNRAILICMWDAGLRTSEIVGLAPST